MTPKRTLEEVETVNAKALMKLSRLRDIGWREWDPIGLLADGGAWDHQPFADEYDSYLLQVASDLRRGGTIENAINELLTIERDHMGLGVKDGQETRAEATARSIHRYTIELDGRASPASTCTEVVDLGPL